MVKFQLMGFIFRMQQALECQLCHFKVYVIAR